MQQDYLVVEIRDGQTYIVTAPLPEHVNIDRELWAQAEDFTRVGSDIDRPALWREETEQGWVLHLDAVNVACSYRIASVAGDGPLSATLESWAER